MTKGPGGRPTKFDETVKNFIKIMAEQGYTDRQMAVQLNITERTLNYWKHDYPEFFQSLKDWKEVADAKVEASLYERAMGYSCKEVKVMQDKRGKIIEHEVIKHYPPDTSSMIFWLKNRQPDKYRDKREYDVGNTGGKTFKLGYPDNE